MVNLVFIGMSFESFIIIIASILLALILRKYYEKEKHKLTLYLFLIFLFYVIAIFFSWLSKILVLYSNIDYIAYNSILPDPGTVLSWIILRITEFRISFIFLTIAIFISYILKVNIFEKDYKKAHKIIVIIYSIVTVLYSLLIYQKGNLLLDTIAFLLIFIFMAMIYFPFFFSSINSYKSSQEKKFKNAFLSLALMAIFFILVLFNFLLDRLTMLFGGPGFSVFYFLAWIFVLLGIIAAYYGYIRPRTSN
jgi:MFS family permease